MVPQGGVGDRHLVTIPQGVVGDRLPWDGEQQGGGRVQTPPPLFGGRVQPNSPKSSDELLGFWILPKCSTNVGTAIPWLNHGRQTPDAKTDAMLLSSRVSGCRVGDKVRV